MIYFFRRGQETRAVETRLNPNGQGYELVITEDGATHVETFATLPELLEREHELLQSWRAQGWSEVNTPVHRLTPPS